MKEEEERREKERAGRVGREKEEQVINRSIVPQLVGWQLYVVDHPLASFPGSFSLSMHGKEPGYEAKHDSKDSSNVCIHKS